MARQLYPVFIIAMGPAAMIAGLLYPPESQFGPNAALAPWVSAVIIIVSAFVVAIWGRGVSFSAVVALLPYLLAISYGAVTLFWTPDISEGAKVLLQLSSFAVVFLTAWRLPPEPTSLPTLRWAAVASIVVIGVLFVTAWSAQLIPAADLGRLMGIATLGLPPAFVLATYARRSILYTLGVGGGAILVAFASDARMVALVLALLLLASPAFHRRPRLRLMVALAGILLVVGFAYSDRFEGQWFFFDEGDSVAGVLDPDADLLAGRVDVWSELVARCDDRVLIGNGLGASNVWGLEIESAFPEPHNEYLRTFCDLGLPASLVFWAFFFIAGVHAFRRVRGTLQPSASGLAALQLLTALALLAVTDIPLTAVAQFLAPLALVLGWSERAYSPE